MASKTATMEELQDILKQLAEAQKKAGETMEESHRKTRVTSLNF